MAIGWGHMEEMVSSEWENRSRLSRPQTQLADAWVEECSTLARATEIEVAGGCLTLERLLKSLSSGNSSGFHLDIVVPEFSDGGNQEGEGFIPEVVPLRAQNLDLPTVGANIPTVKHMDPVLAERWQDAEWMRQETDTEVRSVLLSSRGGWKEILGRLRHSSLLGQFLFSRKLLEALEGNSRGAGPLE